MLYHPLVSIYTLEHQTTGPLPEVLSLDIAISILMSFSSDQVASQWSLEDGTAIRGVHGVCLRGVISFLCMFCSLL